MINKLIEYVFKRKTLNSILFIIVAAIIREALALGFDEDFVELFNAISEKYADDKGFVIILIPLAKIIFSKGSLITLSILFVLLCGIGFLKYKEVTHTQDNKKPKLEIELKGGNNGYKEDFLNFDDNKEDYLYNEHEVVWNYKLIIRNNSSYSAYNVDIEFPDNLSCESLSDLNQIIKGDKTVILKAKHTIRYKDKDEPNFKIKNPFPLSLQPLKIKLYYTNESGERFITLFSIDNDKQTNKTNKG